MPLLISNNRATGISLNFSPVLTCVSRCPYCYCARRTKAQAAWICRKLKLAPGLITSNSGPVTWPIQQAAYRRNSLLLESLTFEGIEQEAWKIARSLDRRGYDNIRFNGTGDSTEKSHKLAFLLGIMGKQAYGFSHKPELIHQLASWCDDYQLSRPSGFTRPHFLLSIDRWTDAKTVNARIAAGYDLNKTDRILAYMALADETPAELKAKPWWKYVKVVLGYHSTVSHTVTGVARECPKTAGRGITCQECRRCFSVRRK